MQTSKEKLSRVFGTRSIIESVINKDENYYTLANVFTWAETPQGHMYWCNKNQKFLKNSQIDQEDLDYLKWLLRDDPIDEGEDEQERKI